MKPIFTTINKTLANGASLIIREATVDDAKELLAVVKEYVEESEFIPYVLGEFCHTEDTEAQWIKSFSQSVNGLLLLAIYENKIVGNISLNEAQRQMMKHTSCIGIGLLKQCRGLGIGSVLFEAAIEWSKKNKQLEYLWLETYASNIHGQALYKKFGFEVVGRQNNFIKISDNAYEDNLIMSLNVK